MLAFLNASQRIKEPSGYRPSLAIAYNDPFAFVTIGPDWGDDRGGPCAEGFKQLAFLSLEIISSTAKGRTLTL